ncbi:MAG: exodeoxyribonuclease VII small subunit, partial [Gammaproteobacteria bacterium]|nr:exodeoxyribonuclease VII small subunit [Gammaproteobacteria bacterium]
MPQAKAFPFEASLKKLETLVETMEAGELSLEESLKAFQEGIAL